MSPNDIEVLIHCHCGVGPHEREGAPAVRAAIARFIADGIIDLTPDAKGHYHTTARGAALMAMLCTTPMPEGENVWVDPRTGKKVGDP